MPYPKLTATLPTAPDISNAVNHGGKKELIDATSVVVFAQGELHEVCTARWYMGRSRAASVVYCSLSVRRKDRLHQGRRLVVQLRPSRRLRLPQGLSCPRQRDPIGGHHPLQVDQRHRRVRAGADGDCAGDVSSTLGEAVSGRAALNSLGRLAPAFDLENSDVRLTFLYC